MQVESLLVNESQLGSQLNNCIHQARRSDFSLMLAMLSQDARDFSQFNQLDEDNERKSQESSLRQLFDLPEDAPLALGGMSDIEKFNQASSVEQANFDDVRLTNCLAPKALSFRDDKLHIPTVVKENLSLCQQQHLLKENTESIATTAQHNVELWLKNVKKVMTKSAEISLHSIA